jgi:hypothetical protein
MAATTRKTTKPRNHTACGIASGVPSAEIECEFDSIDCSSTFQA